MNYEQAYNLQKNILQGNTPENKLISIFEKNPPENLNLEEFKGFLDASLKFQNTCFTANSEVIDICGTGGDGLSTFNISTCCFFVLASQGVKIAKHGNRSASSKSGGADILELLEVKIDLNPQQAEKVFAELGFVFLFAPVFHPAFRFASGARKSFAEKTYFNYLGPILNPARVKKQLIGVSNLDMMSKIGQTLISAGSEKIILVSGENKMDEVNPCGKTHVLEIEKQNGEINSKKYEISPEDFGLKPCKIEDLSISSPEDSLNILKQVLSGQGTQAQNTAVILNSGISFYLSGKTQAIAEGVELAKSVLKSGKALQEVEKMIKISQQVNNNAF